MHDVNREEDENRRKTGSPGRPALGGTGGSYSSISWEFIFEACGNREHNLRMMYWELSWYEFQHRVP